jgi:nitric oxide reductase NorE protein
LAQARRWFLAAAGVGVAFIALKATMFVEHIRDGHWLGASDFWDAYWLGTGFHFAHVVVGVGLLVGVAARVDRATFADRETAVAGSALFWHMCDVAWFFLFPLFFAR